MTTLLIQRVVPEEKSLVLRLRRTCPDLLAPDLRILEPGDPWNAEVVGDMSFGRATLSGGAWLVTDRGGVLNLDRYEVRRAWGQLSSRQGPVSHTGNLKEAMSQPLREVSGAAFVSCTTRKMRVLRWQIRWTHTFNGALRILTTNPVAVPR